MKSIMVTEIAAAMPTAWPRLIYDSFESAAVEQPCGVFFVPWASGAGCLWVNVARGYTDAHGWHYRLYPAHSTAVLNLAQARRGVIVVEAT
jgi:hypothetical protein